MGFSIFWRRFQWVGASFFIASLRIVLELELLDKGE
jgi:hypothetical protein